MAFVEISGHDGMFQLKLHSKELLPLNIYRWLFYIRPTDHVEIAITRRCLKFPFDASPSSASKCDLESPVTESRPWTTVVVSGELRGRPLTQLFEDYFQTFPANVFKDKFALASHCGLDAEDGAAGGGGTDVEIASTSQGLTYKLRNARSDLGSVGKCPMHPLQPCQHLRNQAAVKKEVAEDYRRYLKALNKLSTAEEAVDTAFTLYLRDQSTAVAENNTSSLSRARSHYFQKLKEIAEEYGFSSGHWSFYFDHDTVKADPNKLDFLWLLIVYSFFLGPLQDIAQMIRTIRSFDGRSVAVHNESFLDQMQVFKLDHSIRSSGIRRTMKYKPDVYSACNITHTNALNLRPTIFRSEFNHKQWVSLIRADYTPEYDPDIRLIGPEPWINRYLPKERVLPFERLLPIPPDAPFRRSILNGLSSRSEEHGEAVSSRNGDGWSGWASFCPTDLKSFEC